MKYLVFIFLLIATDVFSQCKSGDCKNGKGTYDFGWCIYTGNFKDGKPDGVGTIKYDDYSYSGEFKDGLENGNGIITYKDGRKENVHYNNGIKDKGYEKIDPAGYKPLEGQDDECIRGNCITGFGTVQFPSGNKYVGNFVNRKRQGAGIFYFANGDKFEGTFSNDQKENGTYTFSNGYTYIGNYVNEEFNNGIFKAANGQTVAMKNGKVIAPPPTDIIGKGTASGSLNCANTVSCPRCHGSQIVSKPIEQKLSWSQKDTYAVDRYGNKSLTWAGQSGGNTYSIPNYTACDRCGGKGVICK